MPKSLLLLVCAILLLHCGGGDAGPGGTPSPGVVFPTPPEPWGSWTKAHHHPIRSISIHEPKDDDLDFLKTAVGDRRFVLLGESTHGCGSFNGMKGRIMRYLHERMGFNVMAFEANVYGCFRTGEQLSGLTGAQAMGQSIYGVWWSQETADLFDYIKRTRTTPNPLHLAGLDCQGPIGKMSIQGDLEALVGKLDPTYAKTVSALFTEAYPPVYGEAGRQLLTPKRDRLQAGLKQFEAWITTHLPALEAAIPERPLWPRMARLESRGARAWLDEACALTGEAMQAARDRFMADAAIALAEEFYPGQKIILWAHDGHVSMEPTLDKQGKLLCKNLGGYLAETHASQMYVLGLTLLSGEHRFNDRSIHRVRQPSAGSLEAILAATGSDYGAVDFLNATPQAGNSWMREVIPTFEWGEILVPKKPVDYFHGVLYVRKGQPISYLGL